MATVNNALSSGLLLLVLQINLANGSTNMETPQQVESKKALSQICSEDIVQIDLANGSTNMETPQQAESKKSLSQICSEDIVVSGNPECEAIQETTLASPDTDTLYTEPEFSRMWSYGTLLTVLETFGSSVTAASSGFRLGKWNRLICLTAMICVFCVRVIEASKDQTCPLTLTETDVDKRLEEGTGRHLDFSDGGFHFIEPGAFNNAVSAEDINLSNNLLTSLQENLFKASINILRIYLEKCLMDSFLKIKSPTVEYINAGGNRIKYIAEGDLNSLPQLAVLDLSDNEIENVHPKAFCKLQNLITAYLARNKLTSLPLFDLNFQSKLSHVDVASNNLTSLSLGYYKALANVDSVNVTDDEVVFLMTNGRVVTFAITAASSSIPCDVGDLSGPMTFHINVPCVKEDGTRSRLRITKIGDGETTAMPDNQSTAQSGAQSVVAFPYLVTTFILLLRMLLRNA